MVLWKNAKKYVKFKLKTRQVNTFRITGCRKIVMKKPELTEAKFGHTHLAD